MAIRQYMTIVVGFVLTVVAGCGGAKSTFMGVTYSDPEKALAAQRTYNDSELKNIRSLAKPLANRGLVILPSRSLFLTGFHGQRPVAEIIAFSGKKGDFFYQTRDLAWDFNGEAVRKRRIFEEVQVERSDKPESLPGGDYDAIIYISLNLQQWFMKTRNQTEPVPLYADESKAYSLEHTMSWLENIEKVLAGE